MKVREATIADLSRLVGFTLQEASEAEGIARDTKRLEQGVKAALEDRSIAMYWMLIDESEQAIGSVSALKEWSDWNAGYYWWIQSMYIMPTHRGRGYMTTLLEVVEQEMKRQNGLELRLYVHKSNHVAVRAYEKAGFQNSPYNIMVRRKLTKQAT